MHVTKNPAQGSKTADNTAPQIWLVLGDKRGDNAQVEAIIEALGWPYERKQLYFRASYVIDKPSFGASIQHLDTTRSD